MKGTIFYKQFKQCYSMLMDKNKRIRVVLDTNVVFEGLTKRSGVSGTIINAWFAGLIQVCVTDALVYESIQVLPDADIQQQSKRFNALMTQLGHPDRDFAREFLANREVEEPQDQATASLIEKVEQRIASMAAG